MLRVAQRPACTEQEADALSRGAGRQRTPNLKAGGGGGVGVEKQLFAKPWGPGEWGVPSGSISVEAMGAEGNIATELELIQFTGWENKPLFTQVSFLPL